MSMPRNLPAIAVLATAIVFVCTGVFAHERLPTSYEAGHFFATPQTRDGKALRLVVDTGGAGGSGLYVLSMRSVHKLNLPVATCDLGGERLNVVKPFLFQVGKGLPVVGRTPCSAVALSRDGYRPVADEDGTLGAGYLPHFVWTFDYPAETLWRESADWKPVGGEHAARLGFQRNAKGGKGTGLPRITLTIDGEPLDLLLDTGATAVPTAEGLQATGMDVVRGIGTTSYITTSVMNRWHHEHPDWRLVADGDELGGVKSRLIEVPKVQIAGWLIGPVWFTERPDANFGPNGISQYTDHDVHGSAGANIFRDFSMTLDYPRDTAWFKCVSGCVAVEK
jgi:hypothetical protein